jgi:hypothetical protein
MNNASHGLDYGTELEFATSLYSQVRFEVLTVVSMKITAFTEPLTRHPDDGDVRTSETSVSFYESRRRNVPEDCYLIPNEIAKHTKLSKLLMGNEINSFRKKFS